MTDATTPPTHYVLPAMPECPNRFLRKNGWGFKVRGGRYLVGIYGKGAKAFVEACGVPQEKRTISYDVYPPADDELSGEPIDTDVHTFEFLEAPMRCHMSYYIGDGSKADRANHKSIPWMGVCHYMDTECTGPDYVWADILEGMHYCGPYALEHGDDFTPKYYEEVPRYTMTAKERDWAWARFLHSTSSLNRSKHATRRLLDRANDTFNVIYDLSPAPADESDDPYDPDDDNNASVWNNPTVIRV